MELKIEDFNWNLRCFLDALSNFDKDVGIGDNMTLNLLAKAQQTVEKLTKNLQFDRFKNANEMIMCSMDLEHFEMRRNIYCLRCEKSLPATRRHYLLHSADSRHHMKMIEHANLEKTGQTIEPAKKSLNCDANNNKSIKMLSQATVNNNKPHSLLVGIDTSRVESLLSIEKNQLPNTKTADFSKKQQQNIAPNENACQLGKNMPIASPQNLFKPKETETPTAAPINIPNVFDDNIYEFLETRKKQQNILPTKPDGPVKSVWQPRPASMAEPSTSKNIVENCRERTNVTTAPDNANKPKLTVPFGSAMKTVNGLEYLYSQFPHLDPGKVKNPLEPTPMTISDPSTNKTSNGSGQPLRKSDGLDKLAEMLNRKNEAQQKQTPPLHGSLFSFNQQSNTKPQPSPISPPNSFQSNNPNIDLNMVPAGVHPYTPFFNDPSFHGARPDMMFQHFPNNIPPGYGLIGPYPTPWSHPASASPLMQQFPQQPQSKQQPNSSKLAALKKNNLSNSMTSLPATFNGQTKRQQQEHKNEPAKNRSRASSVIDMDTRKKSNGENAKENETKRKSSPSVMTEFFAEDLSARINFISKSNSTFGKNKTADLLMKQVISLLGKKFNNIKTCRLIGSRAYDTAIDNNTPVDIYLDLLDGFHKDKSGAMIVNAMTDVQKILCENNEWSDVKCSEPTRYGVLSATNTKHKLKCHFRLGTGVAVRNSEVIQSLFAAQPVCRQIVICVRLLMQEMQSSDGNWLNKFNGYIVTLMVIFYFQVNKKLPSINSLQTASADREQCGENNVSFSKPKNVAICKDRLRVFLLGFFEFYKNFQYDRKIISPFEGHEIAHDIRKSDEKDLSYTVNRFKKMILSGPQKWITTTLCIQDIFEHKNNAGYSVKNDDIKAFKYFCTKALNGLQANGDSVKY